MTKDKIKVNSLEELITKAKEFATSHGGTAATKINSSAVNSGEYTFRKGKTVQKNNGRVEMELKGDNNSSVKFFLEDKEKGVEGSMCNHELYQKVIRKLAKHGISHGSPSSTKKNENPNDEPQKHGYSAINIPCHSLQEIKERIKDYYQKNQAEIKKNLDFNQWVKTTYCRFGDETNYSKDGKETSKGHVYEWTVSLKEYEEKGGNTKINLCLKVKREENDYDFCLSDDEKELENYWNSLVGNKNSDNNHNSSKPANPNHKYLVIGLSIGGAIILVVGIIFLVGLIRKRKIKHKN